MNIVGKAGTAVIIEHKQNGILRRVLLPKSAIRERGGKISPELLSIGMEIGIEVEEAFEYLVFPSNTDVLNHLRENGIWTAHDVVVNVQRFRKLLIELFGDVILDAIREIS